MARRFVRVDLSRTARDYRPIAFEPGLPLLDREGANARMLQRWLGRMAAEPEWVDESVDFYVRDDQGGRLEDVDCQPATRSDLATSLSAEVQELRDRLDRVQPETPTERILCGIVRRSIGELLEDPQRDGLDSYFFRYRDVQGRWRLVWCWGYQRADQEAAPATICPNGLCASLYVRRPGGSGKCPRCAAGLSPREPRDWRKICLVGLLLVALLGAGIYWAVTWRRLVVTPWTWSGPAGARATFTVVEKGLFAQRDVTAYAVAVSGDRRILRLDGCGGAVAAAPGETSVQFILGKLGATVAVKVRAARAPTKIAIEPGSVELGVGTTARLKLIADYDDGTKANLTDAALWTAQNDGIAFLWDGLAEGVGEGATSITARYQPDAETKPLDATATVTVRKLQFQALEASVAAMPVGVGGMSPWHVDAVTADGKRFSVADSSLLNVVVEPLRVAYLSGPWVMGQAEGAATLRATFDGRLQTQREFAVGQVPRRDTLIVRPAELSMVIDEIVDLSIAGPLAPVQVTSSDPQVVEVTAGQRLVGRSAGEARVEVVQGEHKATVPVKVALAEFRSAAIEPARIGVPVDDVAHVRMTATTSSGRVVEIAPDRLTWEKGLSPRFAEFDLPKMALRGVEPTDPKAPQNLALRLGKCRASAPVAVIVPPLRLEVAPTGPIEVPWGQRVKLQAWALYHGTRRIDVPAERIDWHTEPAAGPSPGISVKNGYVCAWKANAGPIDVWGKYFGRESNRVTAKSVDAAAVRLRLQPDPNKLGEGQAGVARLTASVGESAVDLVPELAEFTSSNPAVLAIDKVSGVCRAMTSGESLVTAKHPAAKESATAGITVTGAPAPKRDVPIAVRILSDQGPSVQFAVGSAFDDFRVEAEYADGVTRLVTKKATLRTSQSAEQAPLSVSRGKLLGVRAGQTTVQAEFDGVHSGKGLGVTVTGELTVDQIVLRPSPAAILPGETVTLDAVGYNGSKSVGSLSGYSGLTWKSADEQIARIAGPAVSGVKLGQTTVTAQWNSITSQPAAIHVVDTATDRLTVDPRHIEMVVGESRQIGSDVVVARGPLDVSRLCSVGCSPLNVVEYRRDTNSLVAVAPGTAVAAFACGDQLATATVEVLPAGGVIRGDVVVEPASSTLIPGQLLDLRVYVVDSQGTRYDRTESALLRSLNPESVKVLGHRALAIAPVSAELLAAVSGSDKTGKALVTVGDGKLTDLFIEPAALVMSVGERADLHVMGRGAGGTYELYVQPRLTASVGGANPEAIHVAGATHVEAVAPGQAEIDIAWGGQFLRKVPVVVTADRLTDLQIAPSAENIEVGDRVVYAVTGLRNGRRQVLGPADGVQLHSSHPEVGQVVDGSSVRGLSPGHTLVVAQLGGELAEAGLTVSSAGSRIIVHDRRGRVVERLGGYERVILPDDVVNYPRSGDLPGTPSARIVGLQFVPDVLRMPLGAGGAAVRVWELLADGRFGRDVSNEPGLEITQPQHVARWDHSAAGPIFRPVEPGETRATAQLGPLTTIAPLLIQVGDGTAGAARLEASPGLLTLAPGEIAALHRVAIDPGVGQAPFEVDYRLTVRGVEGIVAVDGGRRIRALASGTASVEVTAVAPGQPYHGLSTIVHVDVGAAERVWIEPGDCTLAVGQQSPRFVVLAAAAGAAPHEVPVPLETGDAHVLAPDAATPGRFIAQDFGATQLRALYHGREALVNVNVSGKRFTSVTTSLNEGDRDFDVTIEVTAAASEGPLEYRVYQAGETPGTSWQPAQPAGPDARRVVLHSPHLPYASRSSQYRLILESRDAAGKVQQYPFTFRLVPKLERTDKKAESGTRSAETAAAGRSPHAAFLVSSPHPVIP